MSSIKVVCPNCLKVNKLPYKESYVKANCGNCKHSLLDNYPVEVNSETMNHFLQNSSLPIVVDFWAPWCGPCRMMAPNFLQAAKSMPLKAQFLKVNTEDNPQLGAQFGIRSIPTMILFKDGREVDRVSGALTAPQIIEWINSRA